MFAGKKSAQIREILISESAWEEMTCLFAPSLDDALLQLREFIDENSGEFFVHVWGNGANFDNTILRRSYERQGIPCPWRYYNDRDVRTIVELGKAIDFDARTAIPFEGERHNALDDARYQAKYVSAIWQKLIPSQADS